jgi:hypothetical protein
LGKFESRLQIGFCKLFDERLWDCVCWTRSCLIAIAQELWKGGGREGRETSCSSKHGVHAEADAERGPGRVGQGCQCHPSGRCKRYLRGRCRNSGCRYHSLGTLGCKVRLIYNYLLLIVSVTIILLLHKIQTSELYHHHVFSEAEWRPINVYYIDPLGFPISRQSALESAQTPTICRHECMFLCCLDSRLNIDPNLLPLLHWSITVFNFQIRAQWNLLRYNL